MAAVESNAAIIKGQLGGKVIKLMLDSGSSVCLVRQSALDGLQGIVNIASKEIRLVTAAGEVIPVLKRVSIPVKLGPYRGDHPSCRWMCRSAL